MDIDSSTGKLLYMIFLGFICIGICGMVALAVPGLQSSNSTAINETVSTQAPSIEPPVPKTLDENITEPLIDDIIEEPIEDIPVEEFQEEDVLPEEEYVDEEIPITEPVIEETPVDDMITDDEEEVLVPIQQPIYSTPQPVKSTCTPAPAATPTTAPAVGNPICFKKIVNKNGYITLDPKYAGMEVEVIIRGK